MLNDKLGVTNLINNVFSLDQVSGSDIWLLACSSRIAGALGIQFRFSQRFLLLINLFSVKNLDLAEGFLRSVLVFLTLSEGFFTDADGDGGDAEEFGH